MTPDERKVMTLTLTAEQAEGILDLSGWRLKFGEFELVDTNSNTKGATRGYDEYLEKIFSHGGKTYALRMTGSSSPDGVDWDPPQLDCPEVKKVEITTRKWREVEPDEVET